MSMTAGESWIEVDESLSEQLLPAEDEDDDELSVTGSISSSELSSVSGSNTSSVNGGNYRYVHVIPGFQAGWGLGWRKVIDGGL